jgi:serine phosphatase RsbU (regulator of sigma subunit)/anti-sigma regulatory factor (Ser/Thr protein kinase)
VRSDAPGDTAAALPVGDVLGTLDAVRDAVLLVDDGWRVVHANAAAAALTRRALGELLGHELWELFPDARDHPTYEAAHEVARNGRPAEIVWELPAAHAWFEQRIVRSGGLVAIVSREVTAAQDDAERRRRLSRISQALAAAETPEQVCVVITDLALPLAGASSGGVLVRDDDPNWIRAMRWVGLDEQTREEFTRYPLSTAAPGAEAIRVQEFVWGDREETARRWAAVAPALQRTGAGSVAGVPLLVRGEALGALVLQFTSTAPPDAATEDFLRTVAAVCAQALHRTRRLAAEHEVALFLQRSLLPQVPDRLAQISLHARYRPGDPGIEVGGDWYDVVPLGADGEQVVLVVADVQGHDLVAASIMGQLRSVARALALEGLAPGVLLARLDHFLQQVTGERIVTALVVLVDASSRFVVTAGAGHPAPLVLAPTPGEVTPLPLEPGPPLGVGGVAVWPETTSALVPGATLLAFTDGLVETRRRDIDASVDGLARLLGELPPGAGPQEVVERALTFLPPGERGDDVAVLAVRLDAPGDDAPATEVAAAAPRRARRTFPPQEIAVPLARRWMAAVLPAWALTGDGVDAAPLVLSELVGNAVRHTRHAVEVTLEVVDDGEAGRALDVAVHDDSHRLPSSAGWPGDDEASGRGLPIVRELAAVVRVQQHPEGGKTVHALLAL